MEKQRREKVLAVVSLIVSVICLSIAFAAMSTNLIINGDAALENSSWDIHFENLSEPKIVGTAKELKEPSIDDTTIKNVSVSLKNPGDSVTYEFDIVNAGTTDAKSDGYILNGYDFSDFDFPSLVSSSMFSDYDNFTDEEKLKFLKSLFTSCDIDGDGITTDEEYKKGLEFINFNLTSDEKGSDLNANTVRRGTIKIYFDKKSLELPKGMVSASFKWELKYVQK